MKIWENGITIDDDWEDSDGDKAEEIFDELDDAFQDTLKKLKEMFPDKTFNKKYM